MNQNTVNRLNNEYRALTGQALAVRASHGGISSREEGLCYQKAAEICGMLATMNIGAEASHWMNQQEKCQERMRIIWNDLYPQKKVKTEKTASDAEKEQSEKEELQAGSGEIDIEEDETIPRETVLRWFKKDPGYGFDEVAGMDEVKALLNSCVKDVSMEALTDYLGLPTVQSFFFYGPPGCGKTYVIEAFAHELMQRGYKFMSLKSGDIHSKFSGEADKIVERAFREAIRNAPCILFMDEVDGVCQNRSMPNLSDFNMQLTTSFLTCFNEFNKANKDKKSVIFIGATNYPANVDTAMLDRVELIQIPLPDEKAREYSFRSKFENMIQLDESIAWKDMAEASEGYNQRDINHVSVKIKKMIRSRLSGNYETGEQAAKALKNGEFKLTKALFNEAVATYTPSPKDDVERKLNEFEEQMRSI